MSIGNTIAAALSGLNVASRRAEVVASNVANAMTEGYGRRSLAVSSHGLGGVRVEGVHRQVDAGLIAARRLADADLEAGRFAADHLGRIELMVGRIGEDGGLAGRLAEVEASLVAAAADPASEIRLTRVTDALGALSDTLNSASDGIQSLRSDLDGTIAEQVAALNGALVRVERLNVTIAESAHSGVDPSALMDQRQQAVDSIAALVPIREIDRGGGEIALMSVAGQMLLDGRAYRFDFAPATYVTADMTLASGALSGLSVNGLAIAGDGVGRLVGGRLGQAFALRDAVLPAAQDSLDPLARDLIERLSGPADPTLGPGMSGLMTDAGTGLAPGHLPGLAGRIALNAAVDPARGGAARLLRDGLASAGPGPAGSAVQLERWTDALREALPLASGGQARSAAGHAASTLAEIGAARVSAERDTAFHGARRDTLRNAELSGGVDTDVELQSLLQIEQAYAANAQVLRTVDSLIRILLEF
ncbi:flagellar hook-associated protein FlgK [Histidinibacterium lentulum]|uniref:Flagellar hook-associated protein 1 n=1 Tax=Histidinibacterium lentulum TaxID=2480588 RepID=A0A3N2R6X5_9RHOB|nr:flagellar hook-associated protein FlgK [Histidinibacterium lentulum]ROU03229.1 flagellar hook-associated protein FlgK [Histidinibacterium lentulum]